MEVTAEQYCMRALKLSIRYCQPRQRHQVQVFPSSFFVLPYISYLNYTPGDTVIMKLWKLREGKANLEPTPALVRVREEFIKQQTLHLVAIENIRVFEELFGDYVMGY